VRWRFVLVAATLVMPLATLPSATAHDEGCLPPVSVRGVTPLTPGMQVPHLRASAALCATLLGDTYALDRFVAPAATHVAIVVYADFGGATPTLPATLDGWGLVAFGATLTRRYHDASDEWRYVSEDIALPAPDAPGALHVVVAQPTGSWHVAARRAEV